VGGPLAVAAPRPGDHRAVAGAQVALELRLRLGQRARDAAGGLRMELDRGAAGERMQANPGARGQRRLDLLGAT